MPRALLWIVICLPLTAFAQDDADILFQADFEQDTSGIIPLDPQATLSVTKDPNFVFEGEGSLQLSYSQRPMGAEGGDQGLPGAMLLPISVPSDKLQAVSFAVSCQSPTALGVVLTEGNEGPRYVGLVWCEGDLWDEVILPLSRLQPDHDGPEDPNGKLDPEEVTGIVIIDVGGAFRMAATDGLFYHEPPDEQTIWLDNFRFLSSDPTSANTKLADNVTMLNDFEPPLMGALLLGGEDRTLEYDDGPEGGNCIKITYALPGNTLLALAQPIAGGLLEGAASIRLSIKASAQTQLVIALEEGSSEPNLENPSYAYIVEIAPAAPWKVLDIPLSQFQLDVGKTDADGKLTPGNIQSIVIADASAMADPQRVSNTLWLDDLAVVR